MNGTASVLFVCLGNICRSPMAEMVLKEILRVRGCAGQICVASAATSSWELGNPIHEGSVRVMRAHGIPMEEHRATLLLRTDYALYDRIYCMDVENLRDVRRICGGDPEGKVRLLLSVLGEERAIADPWYTGDFEATYRDVYRACTALARELCSERREK